MNKTLLALALFACGVPLCAQAPAAEKPAATAVDNKTAVSAVPGKEGAAKKEQPAARAPRKTKEEVKKAAAVSRARKEDDSYGESGVLIDSRTEGADAERFDAPSAAEQGEPEVSGGIPASYGQCKGIINEAGRTILVLESQEDGAVSFVQVTVKKNSVSWKLVDRIPRGAD